jgi:hypothetical protein
MENENLPKIIEEVGFDFWWDIQKVWNLDYPTEEMCISQLEWQFEIPFWTTGERWYDLKPIDVINNRSRYTKEYERTLNSDLEYPIDIMMNKSRWTILDGMHRLLKAKILGLEKVTVRKIPISEIPNIVR